MATQIERYTHINFESELVPVEEILTGEIVFEGSGFTGNPLVKKGVVRAFERGAPVDTYYDLEAGEILVSDGATDIAGINFALQQCPVIIAGQRTGILSHLDTLIREAGSRTYMRAVKPTAKLHTGDMIFVTKNGIIYKIQSYR